ncbi:MAG TPA: TIGR03435 family protein [Candidatus Sulfopaludibacter sp.]|jgi:uncharacterized protein (TIGR03435 family)|nr:TIGR03435 family protein [Candidatus Sulfopaludibacter sp.]
MASRVLGNSLVVLVCAAAWGQRFDVASVKPAAPLVPDGRGRILFTPPSGGPGSKDPGRIRYPNMSLKQLLMNAYDVKNFQITGPVWLDSERFDINATMPPETTKEQFRTMLQNLLADRFKMAAHRETKELPMYSLEVAKGGSKLKESPVVPANADPDALPDLPSQPKMGGDGFPILPPAPRGRGTVMGIFMPTKARLLGRDSTMKDLTDRLTNQLSRPVTDETGLTGKYDFTLSFSTDGMNGPGPGLPSGLPAGAVPVAPPQNIASDTEALPDIFAALQSQLGLKLNAKKGPVELIVVDHMEKTPTGN